MFVSRRRRRRRSHEDDARPWRRRHRQTVIGRPVLISYIECHW